MVKYLFQCIEGGFYIQFCDLEIPSKPREEPEEEVEPEFPPIVLPPGIDDQWRDEPPTQVPIVANPMEEHGPVWWYHSDHLGSTSYITDIFGKPVQYIEYLPFTSLIILFALVFGALREGKSKRS